MKHDKNKVQLSLLQPDILIDIASVFMKGAKKYGRNNWMHDADETKWSRTYDSTLRHIFAFWDGENNDIETGKSHILHAICQLMILHYSIKNKQGIDDRGLYNGN